MFYRFRVPDHPKQFPVLARWCRPPGHAIALKATLEARGRDS
jgi:hypothetical protein